MPVEEATVPVEEATVPVEEATVPVEEATVPVEDTNLWDLYNQVSSEGKNILTKQFDKSLRIGRYYAKE